MRAPNSQLALPRDYRARIAERLPSTPPNGRRGESAARQKTNAPPQVDAPPQVLQPAAVLLPIVERGDVPHVLLTRRAAQLTRHAGEIALPGGRLEAREGAAAAALREAQEEVGLSAAQVELAGYLDGFATGTGYYVQPVVGFVAPDFAPRPNAAEVAEVFFVPLDFLMDARNHERAQISLPPRTKRGARRVRHFYAMTYQSYYIWGATAEVLRALARTAFGQEAAKTI